eukprot:SAG31_NODE_14659_length_794_cov_0.768345_2_plen_101_part_01
MSGSLPKRTLCALQDPESYSEPHRRLDSASIFRHAQRRRFLWLYTSAVWIHVLVGMVDESLEEDQLEAQKQKVYGLQTKSLEFCISIIEFCCCLVHAQDIY